jgi:hypothetical protein
VLTGCYCTKITSLALAPFSSIQTLQSHDGFLNTHVAEKDLVR